jgi:hypothetical protein
MAWAGFAARMEAGLSFFMGKAFPKTHHTPSLGPSPQKGPLLGKGERNGFCADPPSRQEVFCKKLGPLFK